MQHIPTLTPPPASSCRGLRSGSTCSPSPKNRRSQLLPNVRLDLMGAEHVSLSAREAHELLQREYERWGKIIRESGIKAD